MAATEKDKGTLGLAAPRLLSTLGTVQGAPSRARAASAPLSSCTHVCMGHAAPCMWVHTHVQTAAGVTVHTWALAPVELRFWPQPGRGAGGDRPPLPLVSLVPLVPVPPPCGRAAPCPAFLGYQILRPPPRHSRTLPPQGGRESRTSGSHCSWHSRPWPGWSFAAPRDPLCSPRGPDGTPGLCCSPCCSTEGKLRQGVGQNGAVSNCELARGAFPGEL